MTISPQKFIIFSSQLRTISNVTADYFRLNIDMFYYQLLTILTTCLLCALPKFLAPTTMSQTFNTDHLHFQCFSLCYLSPFKSLSCTLLNFLSFPSFLHFLLFSSRSPTFFKILSFSSCSTTSASKNFIIPLLLYYHQKDENFLRQK